ncbi:unnamed protein product [Didymodactylos carnosus]|uniref:Uncharacterized protein n=1 Tax=Didymodactylos carnosus TaxID=1234261 RepID=A0A8S2CRT1_9BILA|nr:unnamed protein product [Didymodactylos carnosus]CAF3499429.1 unnamed protein product [Didymodactylos carnosus]
MLSAIAQKEKIEISQVAQTKIVELAEGSARDAITMLDQVRLGKEGAIDEQHIEATFGLVDKLSLIKLLKAFAEHDLTQAVAMGETLANKGLDLPRALTSLLTLTVEKVIFDQNQTSNLSKSLSTELIGFNLKPAQAVHITDALLKALTNMKQFDSEQLIFRMALVEASQAQIEVNSFDKNSLPASQIVKTHPPISPAPAQTVLPLVSPQQTIPIIKPTLAKAEQYAEKKNQAPNNPSPFKVFPLNAKAQKAPTQSQNPETKEIINLWQQNESDIRQQRALSLRNLVDQAVSFPKEYGLLKDLIVLASTGDAMLVMTEDEVRANLVNHHFVQRPALAFMKHLWQKPISIYAINKNLGLEIKEKIIADKKEGKLLPNEKIKVRYFIENEQQIDPLQAAQSIFGDELIVE